MKRYLVIAGVLVTFGFFAFLAVYFVTYGEVSPFETCHTFCARKAIAGAIPYRDFAYLSMPIPLYLTGIGMWFAGNPLLVGRAINIFAVLVGFFFVFFAVKRRTGSIELALVAVFLAGASPHFVSTLARESSAAQASCFIGIALYIALRKQSFARRLAFFSAAIALTIGCDLNCLPVAIMLQAVFVLETDSEREKLVACFTLLAVLSALGAIFVFGSGGNIALLNWSFYREAVFNRHFTSLATEAWLVSPATVLALATGLVCLPRLFSARKFTEILLLAAATVGIVVPLVSAQAISQSIAASISLAAAAAVLAVQATSTAAPNPFRHALWLFPAIALFYPLPRVQADVVSAEFEEITRVLRDKAPFGPILTPLPIVALASGRHVMRTTELGMYSVLGPNDEARARKLKMTTLAKLTEYVKNKKVAAVIQMRRLPAWNFRSQMPSMRPQPQNAYRQFTLALRSKYRRIHQTDTMLVYVPRK